VKIHLKASFDKGINDMETGSSTLGELLAELSKKYPDSRFYNRQREEVSFEYFVELNGQIHDALPEELDTSLEEGDTVDIYKGIDYEED